MFLLDIVFGWHLRAVGKVVLAFVKTLPFLVKINSALMKMPLCDLLIRSGVFHCIFNLRIVDLDKARLYVDNSS